MTPQETFLAGNRNWCRAGRALAKSHKTLNAAWRACTDGNLMAYWLAFEVGGDLKTIWVELRDIADSVGLGGTIYGGSLPNRAKYATKIRARFNSDGSRRKRSKR